MNDIRLTAALAIWAVFSAIFLSEMLFGDVALSWGAAGLLMLAALGPVAALFLRVDASQERESPPSIGARLARIEAMLEQIGHRRPREAERAAPPPPPSPEPAPPPEPPAPAQHSLPLADTIEAVEASWPQIARALDFPRDETDAEGFAALEAALKDPEASRVLQAAEDVLTILAAEGLHMEDFVPVPAGEAVWRAYAAGARGPEISAIGGVTDEGAIRKVLARQRRDGIFRDACLVLARRWAAFLPRLTREADGRSFAAAIDSRTARAFMLTARASGAFGRG